MDLIEEWKSDHLKMGHEAVFVDTAGKLKSVNKNSVDRLLGVFANSHLDYDHARDTGPEGQPR